MNRQYPETSGDLADGRADGETAWLLQLQRSCKQPPQDTMYWDSGKKVIFALYPTEELTLAPKLSIIRVTSIKWEEKVKALGCIFKGVFGWHIRFFSYTETNLGVADCSSAFKNSSSGILAHLHCDIAAATMRRSHASTFYISHLGWPPDLTG